MNQGITRFLIPLIFVITGVMAIVHERNYWEAASWFCFAITVLILGWRTDKTPQTRNVRLLAYFFGIVGIILLVLRVTGFLPEPVRPLP